MNADGLLAQFERVADAPDAIPRLRRLILDLAVRGKLVEQDPNDEPASELLKQIAAEKARLLKAGKIKRPKTLPAIENPPYPLPHTWCWAPIREITSDPGQCVPQAPFTYIDVTAIDKENGYVANPKVLQANQAPSRARKIIRKGDVVYSCVRPYLLNIAIIEDAFDPPPIASTAFAVLDGHGLVLPRFQWVVLRSPFMVAHAEEEMRGQAYPAINDTDFARLPFPLPPLAEQHRIVAKVDELMALCDELEAAQAEREATRERLAAVSLVRLNEPDPETFQDDARFALDALPALTMRSDQIQQLRRTILNLAVRGKLVEQDPNDEPAEELLKRIAVEKEQLVKEGTIKKTRKPHSVEHSSFLFEVPPGWAWSRLLDISRKIHYGFTASANSRIDDVRLLRITDIQNDKVEWHSVPGCEIEEKVLPNFKLETGDILVARTGGTIGKSFLVTEIPVVAVFASYLIRIQISREIHERYLKLLFESSIYWKQLQEGSKGAGQPNVNGRTLGKMQIPLPPLAEQHRIVAKVDILMALCDELEASLTTGEETQSRLLDALLAEAIGA